MWECVSAHRYMLNRGEWYPYQTQINDSHRWITASAHEIESVWWREDSVKESSDQNPDPDWLIAIHSWDPGCKAELLK